MKRSFFAFALIAAVSAVCIGDPLRSAWDGPVDGPKAVPSKKILFLASDFKNGGVSGVYHGLEDAAREIGWKISYRDGKGDRVTLEKEFLDSLSAHPDAVVFAGFQPEECEQLVIRAKKEKIVLVGWHAGSSPGSAKNLFVNISTDPAAVARMASEFVISQSGGKAGVVIFNDPRFAVANVKTAEMKRIIGSHKGCRLLSVENIAITDAQTEVPKRIQQLNKQYGQRWTHSLAINDLYYDNMSYPLRSIGRNDIVNVSAGDGSASAFARIRTGSSHQAATISEPLSLQGWQIADELNRAFSGRPASGYITKPLLVTAGYLREMTVERQAAIEDLHRARYRSIWHK